MFRSTMRIAVALAITTVCLSSEAALITGGINFDGLFQPRIGGANTPSFANADNVVITNPVQVSAASGDLAGAFPGSATMNGFSWNTALNPGAVSSPLAPLILWQTPDFTFRLDSGSVQNQTIGSLQFLLLTGTGTLTSTIAGLDPTSSQFIWSGNNGGAFNFSAGGLGVPEPISMAMMGTGLVGIGLRSRRKVKSDAAVAA